MGTNALGTPLSGPTMRPARAAKFTGTCEALVGKARVCAWKMIHLLALATGCAHNAGPAFVRKPTMTITNRIKLFLTHSTFASQCVSARAAPIQQVRRRTLDTANGGGHFFHFLNSMVNTGSRPLLSPLDWPAHLSAQRRAAPGQIRIWEKGRGKSLDFGRSGVGNWNRLAGNNNELIFITSAA